MNALNMTHRWGQRPYLTRESKGSNRIKSRPIPVCLDCLVDGFEDERDAFLDCRRTLNATPENTDQKDTP